MRHVTRRPVRSALAGAALAASACLVAPVAAQASPAAAVAPAAAMTAAQQVQAHKLDARPYIDAWAKARGLELNKVIDPSTPCDRDTVFNRWIDQQLSRFSDDELLEISMLGIDQLPSIEADSAMDISGPQFALSAHQQVLVKEFKKLKGFWDIDSSGIQLGAMHGSMLRDRQRVIDAYLAAGIPQDQAEPMADEVVRLVTTSAAFEGGDNPLFTLNAFADADLMGNQPDFHKRIVMGDGVLRAYDELGYGDVAPQTILAHEYGHQVQFALGLFTPESIQNRVPEDTRRTELHADASSAYFTTHPKGMSMQAKRVTQFLAVDYSIGDCQFTSLGHHGTPAQRRAAGQWGYLQEEAARPRSYVQPARTFLANFDKALPGIIAAQ